MFGMIKIKVEETEKEFKVNGVVLEKEHLLAVFPGDDAEKALAKYLCIVPFLHEKAEHFHKHHKLGEHAKWGVDKSHEVLKAIGVPEEAYIPFMLACMAQAETDPDELSDLAKAAFGKCGDPDHNEEDGHAGHTVH
jgi:hypothetical protein